MSTRLERAADRLARYSWLVLLVAVVLALLGSVLSAATWRPGIVDDGQPQLDECPDPPCFDVGGLPSTRDLPVVVPALGYLLAVALGLPSLPAGAWDLLRGRRRAGGRRLLVFFGPVLVLVGLEVVPHLLNPCLLASVSGSDGLPGICQRGVHGVDITERWHLLDHTLVGAVPMAALYGLALRRWRPEVAQLGPVLD